MRNRRTQACQGQHTHTAAQQTDIRLYMAEAGLWLQRMARAAQAGSQQRACRWRERQQKKYLSQAHHIRGLWRVDPLQLNLDLPP